MYMMLSYLLQKHGRYLIFGLMIWFLFIVEALTRFCIIELGTDYFALCSAIFSAEFLSIFVFTLWYWYTEGISNLLRLLCLSFLVLISFNILGKFLIPGGGLPLIGIVGLVAIPMLLSALIRIVRDDQKQFNLRLSR